jgi:hypothetical protein
MPSFRPLSVAMVAAIALAADASEIKTDLPGIGAESQMVERADMVTAGSFEGTWMYVNRDAHFALWIRTKDGEPQVRVQYQSLASPEAFESDWTGKSIYYLAGHRVNFELKLGRCTSDKLTGTWRWELAIGNAVRRETANLVIYRTEFGRSLQMDFQNYERTITHGGKDRVMRTPLVWTWTKVSNRELLWDELPF